MQLGLDVQLGESSPAYSRRRRTRATTPTSTSPADRACEALRRDGIAHDERRQCGFLTLCLRTKLAVSCLQGCCWASLCGLANHHQRGTDGVELGINDKEPLEMVPSLSYLARTSADLMVRRLRSSPWHQWLRLSIGCALEDGAKSAELCLHLG